MFCGGLYYTLRPLLHGSDYFRFRQKKQKHCEGGCSSKHKKLGAKKHLEWKM